MEIGNNRIFPSYSGAIDVAWYERAPRCTELLRQNGNFATKRDLRRLLSFNINPEPSIDVYVEANEKNREEKWKENTVKCGGDMRRKSAKSNGAWIQADFAAKRLASEAYSS